MKFPSPIQDRQSATMSDITNTGRGANVNAPMDKVRKMLSPGARKKPSYQQHKTFGVPLEELVRRAKPYKTPFAVRKICTFIEHNGLDCEGIFRINGNARVVEKLKMCFDTYGDANLEEDGDMMAVAGILKLFLRELPDSVVPEHMTRQFVTIQEENQRNPGECVLKLKHALKSIPEENYDLLKYLIRFLAVVTCNEPLNKMSPMALAIVFGPNLFRCGKGFLALRDQGTTNQIVYRFIADYNNLFKDPDEDTPLVYFERKKYKIAPPRPPPPKFHIEEVEKSAPAPVPVPVPRKSKMRSLEGSPYVDQEDQDHSESSISSRGGRNSGSHHSPAFSDDEMTGRISPFHLDSDSGFSMVESPVPSARTSEFVEKAIKATVIENLFGDESSLLNASIDTTIREDRDTTGPNDVTIAGNDVDEIESETAEEAPVAIKDHIKQFEDTDQLQESQVTKPIRQRPNSKAFDMFEEKGIIITQMYGITDTTEPEARELVQNDDTGSEDNASFENIRRNSDPLQVIKRPAGPPNRRSPSRQLRQSLGDGAPEKMEEQESKEEIIEVIANGHEPTADNSTADDKEEEQEDVNHNQAKSLFAFLDIRHDHSPQQPSPEKSPTNNRKPFIPPLDFSTLHEHVGSQDPILARKAGTVSYQRANVQIQQQEEDEENAALSPRASKVKRKAGIAMDTDMPPSPPIAQDQYKKISHGNTDDELTAKMKHLTKKIQGLKKKIKLFEETFERENGYKPSHAEKAARADVKKQMAELNKARKEVKRLKEEAEMGSRSRHGSGASSTGERTEPPDMPPTMAQTLDLILKRLKEKRKESHRPEDIELMSHEQVQDEKLAVQKALLHFEGIHGRPKTKDEKDLMRPVYDRYRTIKRLLSRQPMSPRELELQTVPEDHPIEIPQQRPAKFSEPILVEPIRVPTADLDDDEEGGVMALGTTDFTVTREFAAFRNATRPVHREIRGGHSPKVRRKLEMQENQENQNTMESNLHELTAPELQDQLIKSRNVKKKLRKTLRDFEEDFIRQNGRKVGRDDRVPMQAEYNEYKQLKARLKLLEALLSKHHQSEC